MGRARRASVARATRVIRPTPAAGPPTTSAGSAGPSTCSALTSPRLRERPRPAVARDAASGGRPPAGPGDTDPPAGEPAAQPGEPGQPVRPAGTGLGRRPSARTCRGTRRGRRRHPRPPRRRPPPLRWTSPWLRQAIELSTQCPPSQTAYSVGAVIVAADGTVLATGFSRGTGSARSRRGSRAGQGAAGDSRLPMATLYSSLEPCGVRYLPAMPVLATGHRRRDSPGGVRLARAAPAGRRRQQAGNSARPASSSSRFRS